MLGNGGDKKIIDTIINPYYDFLDIILTVRNGVYDIDSRGLENLNKIVNFAYLLDAAETHSLLRDITKKRKRYNSILYCRSGLQELMEKRIKTGVRNTQLQQKELLREAISFTKNKMSSSVNHLIVEVYLRNCLAKLLCQFFQLSCRLERVKSIEVSTNEKIECFLKKKEEGYFDIGKQDQDILRDKIERTLCLAENKSKMKKQAQEEFLLVYQNWYKYLQKSTFQYLLKASHFKGDNVEITLEAYKLSSQVIEELLNKIMSEVKGLSIPRYSYSSSDASLFSPRYSSLSNASISITVDKPPSPNPQESKRTPQKLQVSPAIKALQESLRSPRRDAKR